MPPKKPRDRRRVPRSVWDAKHPLWMVLKGMVAVALIAVAGDHAWFQEHQGLQVDASDTAGVAGLGIAARVAWQFFRS